MASRDADALARAIEPYRAVDGLTWTLTDPTLEDVFISLLDRPGE